MSVKHVLLIQVWIKYLWEQYLRARQYRTVVATTEPPPFFPAKAFEKTKSYTLTRKRFDFVQDLVSVIIATTVISGDCLALLWSHFEQYHLDEFLHGSVWYVSLNLVTAMVKFPLSLYDVLVVERSNYKRNGAMERLTTFFWSQILLVVFSWFVVSMVKKGDSVLAALWLGLCAVIFAVGTIYPCVSPLKFRSIIPLKLGGLKRDIQDLAALLKFPLKEIYVEERLKQTPINTIYFYGFSSKNIVLSDFLLPWNDSSGYTHDELLALLCREFNRWYRQHHIKYLLALETNLLLSFLTFLYLFRMGNVLPSLGFAETRPILVEMYVVLKYAMVLYSNLMSTIFICISRKLVFESDAFVAKLGKGEALINGLVRLEANRLRFPVYDHLYSVWHRHRPTLMERIQAIRRGGEWYFWHITDLHYYAHHGDAKKGCWRLTEYDTVSSGRTQRRSMGKYGDYSCDAPWELIESAARTMISRQNDNVEFVLWTGLGGAVLPVYTMKFIKRFSTSLCFNIGAYLTDFIKTPRDALSHTARKLHESVKIQLLQNLTDLLRKTFSSEFVFPALGHDDPMAKKELGKMWGRWLPTDSMHTFAKGGYYMIERKMLKLQIVVLNTNLMKKSDNDEEASEQWKWLDAVLGKFQQNSKTVYLVGHMPPGSDERQRGFPPAHSVYTDYHNRKYLEVVRKFADIIVGQFFGHLHSDTFRVIYGERGRPISWVLLAPSVTPKRTTDGANNPGLRLYKFDKDTGQVLDYSQYYLDLSRANSNSKGEAEWAIEYNFSSYYGITEITPNTLHQLADKLTSVNHNTFFDRYYTANSVRMYSNPQSTCDANCAHNHYCAVTRVDYEEFEHCLKTAASALASSSVSLRASSLFFVLISIVIRRV